MTWRTISIICVFIFVGAESSTSVDEIVPEAEPSAVRVLPLFATQVQDLNDEQLLEDQADISSTAIDVTKGKKSGKGKEKAKSGDMKAVKKGAAPEQTWLKNYDNTVFYSNIKLGSQNEEFKVVVDTGSAILWVPDKICKSPACRNPKHSKFSVHDSSTGKVLGMKKVGGQLIVQAAKLKYGTGGMQGVQVEDTVSFAGVVVPNVGFLVATTVADRPFLQAPFDGILGVGRPTQKINGVQFNVMAAAYEAKKIPQNIISFYLTKDPTNAKGSNAGAVVVGGVKQEFFVGEMEWHKVVEHGPPLWTLDLESLTVGNGANLCPKGCIAVIDTGTSLFVASHSLVEEMNKQLGVKRDCTNLGSAPNLKAQFSGSTASYTLPAHAVTLEVKDPAAGKKLCGSAIRSMAGMAGGGKNSKTSQKWDIISKEFQSKDVIIFGDIFLRHFYSAYDNTDPKNARVGFAKAKDDVDLEAVLSM